MLSLMQIKEHEERMQKFEEKHKAEIKRFEDNLAIMSNAKAIGVYYLLMKQRVVSSQWEVALCAPLSSL